MMPVRFPRHHIAAWFSLWIVGSYYGAGWNSFAQPVISDAVETHRYGAFSDAKALSLSADGKMTVIDGGAGAVIMFSPTGEIERNLNGKGWGQLEFDQPTDVDANPTLRIYVADYGNARVQVFDNNLNFVSTLDGHSSEDNNSYRFRYPLGVAVSRHNDVFVLDGDNARIIKLNVDGTLQGIFGGFDAGKGRLLEPSRIRISSHDILGVIDRNDVLFFDLYGNYLTRYQGGGTINGCAPFISGSQWMIASDSSIIILEPDPDASGTGCKVYGNIQYQQAGNALPYQKEDGSHLTRPVVRDIVIRESTVYILTNHEIILCAITSHK